MWKVWITPFKNVDFTHFSTFLPVENLLFVKLLTIAVVLCQVFFVIKNGKNYSKFNKSLCKTEFKKSLTRNM